MRVGGRSAMLSAELEIRFYDTYYFANVVKNVLQDQLAFIRHLNDFYGDGKHIAFARPFPRFSALHSFLEFIIDDLLSETKDIDLPRRQIRAVQSSELSKAIIGDPTLLPLNEALVRYGIDHTSFVEWLHEAGKSFQDADEDDIDEYYGELRLEGAFDKLLDCSVHEAFYILFSNRRILLTFNEMMSRPMADTDLGEVPKEYLRYFAKPGALLRCAIPQWAKDAVFFRDRGRCVICRCDLSGLIAVGSDKNFDHVVPLAQGGLNDVTNIQLLCATCNSKKGYGEAETSDFYQSWYDLEEK